MSRGYGKSQRKREQKKRQSNGVQGKNSQLPSYRTKMYHMAPKSRRDSIMKNGLQPGHEKSFTKGSGLIEQHYDHYPIFLSVDKTHCGDHYTLEDEYDLYEVNTYKLELIPDFGQLSSLGAYIMEEDVYFTRKNKGLPQDMLIEDCFDINLENIIETTKTAATYGTIPPNRLKLLP